MKTLTCYLTSEASAEGDTLNGYLFADPIAGTASSYALTADGGITEFAYVSSYTLSAYGGLFFPYGFGLVDKRYDINLSNLKGDYTISFCLTGLSTSPIKVVYDFGESSPKITVIQPLLNAFNFNDITPYLYGDAFESPKYRTISHNYYADSISSRTTTITAINPNLTIDIFNITFNQYPNSLYDLGNIHLLDAFQQSNRSSVNITEVGDNKNVAYLSLNSNTVSRYPLPYTTLSAENVTSTSTDDLIFDVI